MSRRCSYRSAGIDRRSKERYSIKKRWVHSHTPSPSVSRSSISPEPHGLRLTLARQVGVSWPNPSPPCPPPCQLTSGRSTPLPSSSGGSPSPLLGISSEVRAITGVRIWRKLARCRVRLGRESRRWVRMLDETICVSFCRAVQIAGDSSRIPLLIRTWIRVRMVDVF